MGVARSPKALPKLTCQVMMAYWDHYGNNLKPLMVILLIQMQCGFIMEVGVSVMAKKFSFTIVMSKETSVHFVFIYTCMYLFLFLFIFNANHTLFRKYLREQK